MKFRHIIYSISLLLICSCSGRYSTATQENLGYFAMVEEALNNKDYYLEDFNNRVSEIHQRLANSMDRESIYIYQRLLAEMYMGYEADTALAYIDKNLQRAEELKRTDWIAESLILKSQTYNTSGMIDESREVLDKVKQGTGEVIDKVKDYANLSPEERKVRNEAILDKASAAADRVADAAKVVYNDAKESAEKLFKKKDA